MCRKPIREDKPIRDLQPRRSRGSTTPSGGWAMKHLPLFAAALLASCASLAPARTIYVSQSAAGLSNGTDWANAFSNLHQGLAAATNGDEVRIGQGTYRPGLPGEINASFVVPSGVRVRGGYKGFGADADLRSRAIYPTILDGDLGDDDSWGDPWWNGMNTNTPNSYHVLQIDSAAAGTLLEGLTVTSGGAIQTAGGAVLAQQSELEIRDCTFERCLGYQGAGAAVCVIDGSLSMTNCTVRENWGRFVNGAGVAVSGTAGATVDGCLFFDNHGESDYSTGSGAGIALEGTTPSTIKNSRFIGNQTFPFFSSMPDFGGGVYNSGAPLSIDRCTFESNTAVSGGGVYSWRDLTVSNCLFRENNAIPAPAAGGNGGAIGVYYYGDYLLKVVGCTFVKNNAHETGGVYYHGYATYRTDISNSIFWGNTDVNGTVSQSSVKKARYSCIQNLWTTIPGEDAIDPSKFPGCVISNPSFVHYPDDLHLTVSSPCVDAGEKSKFSAGMYLDLQNRSRFFDIVSKPDTGLGSRPLPDMGCYETTLRLQMDPSVAYGP